MGARVRAGFNIVWLLVIGSGVGWLVGISLSPVLQVVVGSVIASLAALVGVVSGVSLIKTPEQNEPGSSENVTRESRSTLGHSLRHGALQVDALPLGIVVVGLWVGSSLGIYARTNNWLGPNPHRIASKWATSGLSEADIQRQIFNQLYPPVPSEPAKDHSAPNPALAAGLFAFSVSDCQFVQGKNGTELESHLKGLNQARVIALVQKCQSDESCLESIRDLVCSAAK